MSTTTIKLANGAIMPMAGFGCWKVAKDVCADTIYNAIKVGYRLFDGACDYGNEVQVGEGIRKAINEGIVKREDLFIVSKLWNTFHAPDKVQLACKKTLTDLGLDYVDLYLIHFPIHLKFVPIEERYPPEWIHDPKAEKPKMEFEPNVTYQMTWQAMEALHAEGLVKNIGFCNIGCLQIREVLQYAKVHPAVLQVELHPFLTQERLLRYCKESNIAVMAYSSFGATSYVELGMVSSDEALLDHPLVKKIAENIKKTPGQVLLRWAVQRNTIVIPKTSNPQRLVENISLFDFTLTEEQMKELDGLNKNRRYNDPGTYCALAFNTNCPIFD